MRVDSGIYAGYRIPSNYDSMIAKLIVHGNNREQAIMRLRRAIREYVIDGIKTTLPLHNRLVHDEDFMSGNYDIHWLENFLAKGGMDGKS